jgi:hypothetical protein
VSEFTRTQVIEWSGVSAEKAFNVGCGVDPTYQPAKNCNGPQFPYLLRVSNRERHKNEFRMVEAFARADLPTGMHLVFTGGPTAELTNCIERFHITQRVYFAGVVPEAKLASL